MEPRDPRHHLRWLPVIGVAALCWFLRATEVVTMPIAASLFVVMLVWPVRDFLHRHLPRVVATVATLLVVAVLGAGFVAAIYACLAAMLEDLSLYVDQLAEMGRRVVRWAGELGVPAEALPAGPDARQLTRAVTAVADVVRSTVQDVLLIAVFVVLAVEEGQGILRRTRHAAWGDEVLRIGGDVAARFRRYVGVRTVSAALAAAATGVFCWAVGIRDAGAWALLALLLFYIPTLGNIASAVPPILVALADHGPGRALVVTVGLFVIQVVTGNYVDTKLQGNRLALSPFVVFAAVLFWAWVWGVVGAALGIPLTSALFVIFGHFEATRWIPGLLAEQRPGTPQPA